MSEEPNSEARNLDGPGIKDPVLQFKNDVRATSGIG